LNLVGFPDFSLFILEKILRCSIFRRRSLRSGAIMQSAIRIVQSTEPVRRTTDRQLPRLNRQPDDWDEQPQHARHNRQSWRKP
jgi:hypothetical protein